MLWRVSQGVLSTLVKFGQEIHGSKGVHQNGLLLYFGGFKHFDCNYWILCCSFDQGLVM